MLFVDLSFPLEAANIGSVQQDGFFLIDWVKRTPEIIKSPIIISSTEPEKYCERAAASGIKTCMQKPLNRETLLATVRLVLGDGPKASQPGQP
jgi:CheY-like chemotaxis protein